MSQEETESLVRTALQEALLHYDKGLYVAPRDDFGGRGDPDAARTHFNKALTLMGKLSPAVQAHPIFLYWRDEVQSELAKLPQESEVE